MFILALEGMQLIIVAVMIVASLWKCHTILDIAASLGLARRELYEGV